MTREMIITELQNRGYKAEAENVIKNGVQLEGIRIVTDKAIIAPIFYTKEMIEWAEELNKSLDDVVTAIIDTYKSSKSVNFDVNKLLDKEFVLSHLYIGLQKESTEKLVKRNCGLDGIESYLYIRGETDNDRSYSVRVSSAILNRANIAEGEAWEKAEVNTNAETSLENLAKVVLEEMGSEYSEEMDDLTPFYVISNKSKTKGASAILNKKVLAEFGRRYNTDKIVVLPSSIHEMLIAPYSEGMDLDSFSSMVTDVNNTQVDPTERLTDMAYILTV